MSLSLSVSATLVHAYSRSQPFPFNHTRVDITTTYHTQAYTYTQVINNHLNLIHKTFARAFTRHNISITVSQHVLSSRGVPCGLPAQSPHGVPSHISSHLIMYLGPARTVTASVPFHIPSHTSTPGGLPAQSPSGVLIKQQGNISFQYTTKQTSQLYIISHQWVHFTTHTC